MGTERTATASVGVLAAEACPERPVPEREGGWAEEIEFFKLVDAAVVPPGTTAVVLIVAVPCG